MAEVFRPSSSSVLTLTQVLGLDLIPIEVHTNWVRWCYTSINKFFEDRKNGYELYLEGDERTLQDEIEFAELRIDGPFITIPHKNLFNLDVEINVLCQTHTDPRKFYRQQAMVGTFARIFRNVIPVYKFGDGPLDDSSLLGCFHLQRDLRESIDINYYGLIREDTRLTQTTIEGHYRLELWTMGE